MTNYIKQQIDKFRKIFSHDRNHGKYEGSYMLNVPYEEMVHYLEKSLTEAIRKTREEKDKEYMAFAEKMNKAIPEAIQAYKEELRAWIEKQTKKEIYVGETQYRNDKGNIAYVYNLALEDLINYLTK